MTKSELIARLALSHPHLYLREIERVVNVVFDEVAAALARGDRVELRGFGAFTVTERRARQGRNPRSGAAVAVEAKYAVRFKPGKGLRDQINGRD